MKNLLLVLAGSAAIAHAGLITNPSFETGLSGWTVANQTGSDGAFSIQTGTTSPINALAVPNPPQGTRAAMTDAQGPGTHVLYQDFFVPSIIGSAMLTFSYSLNNTGFQYASPSTLDFSIAQFNQQARVDIITTGANVFSVNPADVLLNIFQTSAASPLVTPAYVVLQTSIAPLLQAHAGETLRLRFAEADNLSFFNFGVDAADIDVSDVPEPATLFLAAGAFVGFAVLRRRRKFSN